MKNKKIVIAVLIFILVIGVVSVFAIGSKDKSWYGHKDWKKSGIYFHKNFEDKSVWLEKLGLPSDATYDQIIAAKKEKWMNGKENHFVYIREKLGLPDDASDEEVWEEKKKWKKGKNFHKGYGFHKGSWCSKS